MKKLLEVIHGQVNELISQNKAAQNELDRLKQENSDLTNELSQKDNELMRIREQLKVYKLAGSVAVEKSDRSELRSQVNELVREVDKCIALLNK